jgi:hypothetical protein
MNKTISIAFALAMGALVSNQAAAVVPDLIPVQGVLSNSSGAPIDALTDITFSLYAQESSGSALWTDTFTDVDVADGFFSVYLGSSAALDFSTLLSNSEIWLGMAVEADPEMNRIRLAAVPFAMEAQTCEQVGSLTEEDINDNFLSSSAPAASITSDQVSDWDEAFGWGDHSAEGYLTAYTETDPVFGASDAADITSTDLSNWDTAYGWGNHATAGYASSGHNHDGTYAALSHTHAAADVTSGTFDNARINWAAPGSIGSTTRAAGAFTSLAANSGLTVSNGTVTLLPSGSGGTSGQVLTTNGAGVATWQSVSAGPSPATAAFPTSNYTMLSTDGLVVSSASSANIITLPTAAAAGAAKVVHIYATTSSFTVSRSSTDTIMDLSAVSRTSIAGLYLVTLVSDGVSHWYQFN